MNSTSILRFTKAYRDFLAGDATLVSLVSYNATTNISIIFDSGEQTINPPMLIMELGSTHPWMSDVDNFYETIIHHYAYTTKRLTSLQIISALYGKVKQSSSQADASFSSNNIVSRSLMPLEVPDRPGEATMLPDSIRRTERSDAPIADRHVARLLTLCRWTDTA